MVGLPGRFIQRSQEINMSEFVLLLEVLEKPLNLNLDIKGA